MMSSRGCSDNQFLKIVNVDNNVPAFNPSQDPVLYNLIKLDLLLDLLN